MKIFLTSLFTLISFLTFSQSVQIDSSYALNGLNKLKIVNGGDDQALLSAVQTDGKILICGSSYSPAANDTYPFVARYLKNGAPDSTFNTTGVQLLTTLPTCVAYSMVLQDDGKIIIAGQEYYQGKLHGIVIRFNTDGSLDTGFNTTGYSRTLNTSKHYFGRSVAMQNDKIVLAGYIEKSSSNSDFFAARFLSTGLIDSTFGTHGIVEKDFGGKDICRGLSVQTDDKIILSGFNQSNSSPNLVRLLANGNEDVSFTSNWTSSSKYPYSFPYQSIILNDDKILSVGFALDSTTSKINVYAMRLLPNGSKDQTFANNGEFLFNLPGEDTYGIYGLERDNGKIVIVGNSGTASNKQMDLFAMGLNSNGSIDSSFQDNGIFSTSISPSYDLLNAVHLGSDNTILATGYYNVASYTHKPMIVQFKIDKTINSVTTLNEGLDFSVYPNPLSSDILRFENKSGSDLVVNIYSITGELVYRDITIGKGTLGTINMESLHSGMYFLKSYSKNTQESKTISFVKK
ncbi:T9SS type A sorting domain-containing protein [bacterium SCSIO 12643]|nr:T9SS type A sorting domain-containing protein [bacterium SCSIO 12643]